MPELKIKTNKPVAFDSPDHIQPWGTKRDNSRNLAFNKKLSAWWAGMPLRVLDLGCSGGGFVKSILDQGGFAVGIEGSDYSLKHKRAEWATIPDHLFTADITVPFQVMESDSPGSERLVQFNLITAWEVLEHIRADQLPGVFQNISDHLSPGGMVIMSISQAEDVVQGVQLHQTAQERAWWLETLNQLGFVHHAEVLDYFGADWVRGGIYEPTSFHVALTRRAEPVPCPNALEALKCVQQAEVWLRQSNQEAARDAFQAALALAGDNPWVIMAWGGFLAHRGELEAARREFVRATVLAPDFAPAYLKLADVLEKLGQAEAAEASLRRAAALSPDDGETHRRLGRMCLAKGQHLEGLQHYFRALQSSSQDAAAVPEIYLQLVETLNLLSQATEVLPARLEGGLYADEVAAWLREAGNGVGRGDLALARQRLDQALGVRGDDPCLLVLRATLMLRASEYEAARRELVKTTALAPQYAPAYLSLALAQWHLDQVEMAEKSVQHALELQPANQAALMLQTGLSRQQDMVVRR